MNRRRLQNSAGALVAATVFAAAVYALHHLLAEITLATVLTEIRGIRTENLLLGVLCTAGSYFALTNYDQLAVRYLGAPVKPSNVATISFSAYALAHNLGFSAFSGGAVRFRGYSAVGLDAVQIATIAGFCTLTFVLGGSLLLAIALLLEPAAMLAHVGISATGAIVIGVGLLVLPLGYLTWSLAGSASIQLGNWQLRKPTPLIAASQIALACIDLLLAATVVFLLLPGDAPVSYVQFLGAYLIAMGAGVLSGVPGGVGVFESLLLLSLPDVPTANLLGALVVFRAIYYLIPLIMAVGVLALQELRIGLLSRGLGSGITAQWLNRITPPAVAGLVFLAGIMLLVSGGLPELSDRMGALARFVPLVLIETSHMINSVVGVLFVVLARSLLARTRAAFNLTFSLLILGILVSLLKGLDYEEAIVLGIVAGLLLASHNAFQRPSTLLDRSYTPGWIMAIAGVAVSTMLLGYFAIRHSEYSAQLFWKFAVEADVPRALRASAVAVITVLGVAVAALLRSRPDAQSGSYTAAELQPIIGRAKASLANVVLLGDKRVLLDNARSAFIMYQHSGTSCIALGDPVGNEAAFERLIWQFREMCNRDHVQPVFYEVSDQFLPLYLDSGFALEKLGEEAIVPLAGFSLEGSQRAELRQERNRALRDLASFEIVERANYHQIAQDLETISNAWLQEKSTGEKGFSLGFFDHTYLANFDTALVRRNGAPVAFANIWRGTEFELSMDLMRFSADAPKGTMVYLLVELMLWGADKGFSQFSLGMAPLSGLETHRLAPLWHKLGTTMFEHGDAFYNFEGLRQFKEKFSPLWEPRYLATSGGLRLPKALLDTAVLIAGGVRNLVTK